MSARRITTPASTLSPRLDKIVLAVAMSTPLVRFVLDLHRGLDYLHFQYLVDDAFYYFTIARHFPYFNSGIPTTGFHPLYAFVAAAFHTSLPTSYAIAACLLVLVTANAACVWLVHRVLRRMFREPVPLIAALGWSVSSKVYALSLTGVESILAVLIVLLFLDRFLRIIQEKRFADTRAMAVLGLCAGVAFWARMDSPLILAPACAYVALTAIRYRNISASLAFVGVTVLVPSTWIATMWFLTGSPLPTSAVALRVLRSAQFSPGTGIVSYASNARAPLRYLAQYFAGEILPIRLCAAVTSCFAAAAGYWILRFGFAKERQSGPLRLFAVLVGLGFVLWASYYVLYQEDFRLWYGTYLAIPVYLLLVPCFVAALLAIFPRNRGAVVAAGAVVLLLSVTSKGGPNGIKLFDKYHGAIAANRYFSRLPEGAEVGSFNTGAYNFYTDSEVINLDGVVNPEAVEAHRERDIVEYMERTGIRYLIEQEDDNSFVWVRNLPGVEFEKWVDLSEEYEPHPGRPPDPVYLWRVTYDDERIR